MEYTGKAIVITGGGSGIGLEMAKSFARDGASVFITGRDKSKLEEAAKANANITPYLCDVSSDDDMRKFRDDMEAKGGVDFFINSKFHTCISERGSFLGKVRKWNSAGKRNGFICGCFG